MVGGARLLCLLLVLPMLQVLRLAVAQLPWPRRGVLQSVGTIVIEMVMLRLEAIEQPMVTKYDKRRRSWRSFGVDLECCSHGHDYLRQASLGAGSLLCMWGWDWCGDGCAMLQWLSWCHCGIFRLVEFVLR